jgi:hypothetical protein
MTFEEFKSNCTVFIINWPRVTQQAYKLEAQFLQHGLEVLVINSDEAEESNGKSNWAHIGNDGYMVQQYAKAIEVFKKTYFVELFADISNVKVPRIFERAYHSFTHYNCGIYAPNAYFQYWQFATKALPKLEKGLYEVPNAESLLTFIHKDVISQIKLDTKRFTIGWGIDFILCANSHLQGKKIIRDYTMTIKHPRSRGYGSEQAGQEEKALIQDQPKEVQELLKTWIPNARAQVISKLDPIYWLRGKLGSIKRKILKIQI